MRVKVQGRFHEITNLPGFVSSFLKDQAHPDPATFKNMGGVRVFVATDFPVGFGTSFVPGLQFKDDADATGAFSIDIPAAIPKTNHAYLLAMREVMKVPILNVPIFAPIYRSATFTLSQVDTKVHDIFVARTQTPNDHGITQAQISQQVGAIAGGQKLQSLTAFIDDHGIAVTGKGQGATVKFEITLSPATGPDLNTFLTDKVGDWDIDLPGPDFLTGLCVSKDDIKNSITKAVDGVLPAFNQKIKTATIDAIAAQTQMPKAVVAAFFDSGLSMTFEQIRFPVVGQQSFGPIKVNFRNVVPDPDFGFPRKLF